MKNSLFFFENYSLGVKGTILLLICVLCCPGFTASQTSQIGNDIDGEAPVDQSGIVSISADGNIVAIGGSRNDGINSDDIGHVRVYGFESGNWTQIGDDIDGEAAEDMSGASLSLNHDGTILAIGAGRNAGNGFDSGHVRVYKNNGGNWTQIGNDINGEAPNDSSSNGANGGKGLSINSAGNIVAIGAPFNDGSGILQGHIRVYENINDNWIQIGNDIDGEANDDLFGASVSLNSDGTIVAVGAHNPFDFRGYVKVFENVSGNWVQIGNTLTSVTNEEAFGWSVDINANGNVIAIGAPLADENGTFSGKVQVFENISGNWTQIGDDINGEAVNNALGYSVSLNASGTVIATGATGASSSDGSTEQSGLVRLFQNVSGSWVQLKNGIHGEASFDQSGHSVSINNDGTKIAVGAPGNDGNGMNSGQVRVYAASLLDVEDAGTGIDTIQIFPNPTTGFINIEVPESIKIKDITLFDTLGRVFLNLEITDNSIDLSALSSGVYYLQLNTINETLTKKIIKN